MNTFIKYLPVLALLVLAFLTISCEENSPTSPRAATVFTWDYVMDDPTYFHSIQEVPPLAVEEDGTLWIAGYLGSPGNSHRCMARRKPGGDWQAWADEGTPGDYYAYDVGVSYNGIYVTLVGNPTLEPSGLYQFIDIPYQFQGFELVYAHPDPGPIACNVDTAVMFTRHMNNVNSGVYTVINDAFHTCTLPNVTGDVLCATMINDITAYAITSDNYLLLWDGNTVSCQPYSFKLYDVSGDLNLTLCTDDGFYTSLYAGELVKDTAFPGDKAFSSSPGGYEMVLGEKNGVTRMYKRVEGGKSYTEETLNYPVGVGRIRMIPGYTGDIHEGYIYDGNALGERVAH